MAPKRIHQLQSLVATPQRLKNQLFERGEAEVSRERSTPERSTVRILEGMITAERQYRSYFHQVVELARPKLAWERSDQGALDREPDRSQLLSTFRRDREQTLAYLTGRMPPEWQRRAVHPTKGEVSLHQLVRSLVNHDRQRLIRIQQEHRLRFRSPD